MKIWGADWWDALSAIGTVAAVLVALGLAFVERSRARRAERALAAERERNAQAAARASAALVSAWVEARALPGIGDDHYERRATLWVANESDRPAHDVAVSVGVDGPAGEWIPLGPLAAPLPIPVVPARSRQSWDITWPLSAATPDYVGGTSLNTPRVAIAFSDPSGARWARGFDMELRQAEGAGDVDLFDVNPEAGHLQVGDLNDPRNPLLTAVAFLDAFSDPDNPDLALAELLMDPRAPGWRKDKADGYATVSSILAAVGGLGAHVHYPAPRVAYVKAVPEKVARQRVEHRGEVELEGAVILTLRWLRGVGWRVFSAGAAGTTVDRVWFPEGDLSLDPRGAATKRQRLAQGSRWARIMLQYAPQRSRARRTPPPGPENHPQRVEPRTPGA